MLTPDEAADLIEAIAARQDKAAFAETAKKLVGMFRENFKRFEAHVDDSVKAAAPTMSIAA